VILVVDDDRRISSATSNLLRAQGYEVYICDNGASALAALADYSAIELIVTDVMMPGMRGTQLIKLALQIRPDLQAIFMSGDIGDTAVEDFGGHDLLHKPFTAAALMASVARALT
jgi:DNA-binding NtrC family response regulator